MNFFFPITNKTRVVDQQNLHNRRPIRRAISIIISIFGLVLFTHSNQNNVYAATFQGPASISIQKANLIEVTTTLDHLNQFDGLCSLREAIIAANHNLVELKLAGECPNGMPDRPDRIVLESGAVYQLTNLNFAEPDGADRNDLDIVNNRAAVDLQIVSDGPEKAIIRGTGPDWPTWVQYEHFFTAYRIFDIHGATVEISGLEISHGVEFRHPGAGIYNRAGHLTIDDSRIINNRGTRGGGIHNSGGTVDMRNSEVTRNGSNFEYGHDDVHVYGGGIANSGATAHFSIENSTIDWNFIDITSAFGNPYEETGGAIYNMLGTVTFLPGAERSEVIHNQSGSGPAIWNMEGIIEGEAVNIFGNHAQNGPGGGIANYNGATIGIVDLHDGFIGFHSDGYGLINHGEASFSQFSFGSSGLTGIRNAGGTVALSRSIVQNSGESGIESEAGTLILDQTEVRNNTNTGYGGGIRMINGNSATITRSSITGNSGTVGGGIYIYDSSLSMGNSTVSNNETTIGIAGGIFIQGNSESETIAFNNVTAAENEAAANVFNALYVMSSSIIPTSVNSIWTGPAGETVCGSNSGSLPLLSDGHNISSDDTCLQPGGNADQVNTDPQLGPLTADAWTSYHPLNNGSPAINLADQTVCAGPLINSEDQLEHVRPTLCDIGAIERHETELAP